MWNNFRLLLLQRLNREKEKRGREIHLPFRNFKIALNDFFIYRLLLFFSSAKFEKEERERNTDDLKQKRFVVFHSRSHCSLTRNI